MCYTLFITKQKEIKMMNLCDAMFKLVRQSFRHTMQKELGEICKAYGMLGVTLANYLEIPLHEATAMLQGEVPLSPSDYLAIATVLACDKERDIFPDQYDFTQLFHKMVKPLDSIPELSAFLQRMDHHFFDDARASDVDWLKTLYLDTFFWAEKAMLQDILGDAQVDGCYVNTDEDEDNQEEV